MKANELRLGNLIFINGKEHAVHSISHWNSEVPFVNNVTISAISYIPLTEEWLLKFGFRNDELIDYRWYIEDWLAYDLDDNCIRITDSWEFGKRKYVHQLQNLYFALTGQELEVVNP